jgi:hypothetical protein
LQLSERQTVVGVARFTVSDMAVVASMSLAQLCGKVAMVVIEHATGIKLALLLHASRISDLRRICRERRRQMQFQARC